MKPTANIFAICDYASVDRDGKLSIMGIFRELFVKKMPAYIAHFYVAATILGEPEKSYDISITFHNEKKNLIIPKQETTVQIGLGGVTNLVTDVVNLPLESIGEYTVTLTTNDGHVVGTNLFRVIDMTASSDSIN